MSVCIKFQVAKCLAMTGLEPASFAAGLEPAMFRSEVSCIIRLCDALLYRLSYMAGSFQRLEENTRTTTLQLVLEASGSYLTQLRWTISDGDILRENYFGFTDLSFNFDHTVGWTRTMEYVDLAKRKVNCYCFHFFNFTGSPNNSSVFTFLKLFQCFHQNVYVYVLGLIKRCSPSHW